MTQAEYQQETEYNPQAPEVVSGPIQENPWEGMIDTYSFGGHQVFTLPDGKQTITYKVLNEGEKARYQRMTNRDIRINRKTEDATLRTDQAADRHALIQTAVIDWNLWTRKQDGSGQWERMQFSTAMLQNWLGLTDPAIVEKLEEAIRKANPWLGMDDVTVDDLDEEIADLQTRRAELLARDAGKGK